MASGRLSLANVPAWHLPARPPMDDTSNTQPPILQTQPALLGAYHHLLTNPPPSRVTAVNPSRYRVALALIQHTEKNNRWDAPATLYGGPAPNLPRVATMPPSYALPIVKAPGTGSGAGTHGCVVRDVPLCWRAGPDRCVGCDVAFLQL